MSVLAKFDLEGRHALVTGGSRGLGREMAAALAEAGADLMLVGRTPDTLRLTRDELLKFGDGYPRPGILALRKSRRQQQRGQVLPRTSRYAY